MTVQQLEEIIKKAAEAYYAGTPIMSDVQFDRYEAWLRAVDPKSPVLSRTGYGYDPKSVPGTKVRHNHGGMESVENKPREIDLIPQNLRTGVRISAKLDGLSGKLEFVNGKFVRCVTRGDGEVGIDKTDKFEAVMQRCGEPQLPEDFTGEIRGEFVISRASWDKLVEAGTAKKNPRNTAAGLINADVVSEDIKYLDFIPYKVIWDQNNTFGASILTEMGDCPFCKYMPGYPGLPKVLMNQYYTQQDLVDMYNGWNLIWPCDGVVITSNSVGKGPEGIRIYDEVAYKFDTLKKVTRIESIDWQISKQSLLKPVANLAPIELDGATISRVTLNNAKWIDAMDIYVGSEVEIMRSGGVIPKLMSVVSSPEVLEGEPRFPEVCPVCGGDLTWEGVDLKCTNLGCGNVDTQNLKIWFNFIGRIDGVAETTAFDYFKRLNIEKVEHIYEVETGRVESLAPEGVTAAKFVEVMHKMWDGKQSLVNALQALNIPRIGDVTCKKIAQDKACVDILAEIVQLLLADEVSYGSTGDRLIQAVRNLAGDATASSLGLHLHKIYEYWKWIARNIVIPEVREAKPEVGAVCITGKLSMPRKDLVAILAENGYTVKEDVTKRVKYLITNEPNGTSSKHKQADALGTPKITEAEMLQLLN